MKFLHALLVLLFLMLFPGLTLAEDAKKEPPTQSEEVFDLPDGRQMHFLLYLPKGYEEKEHWPLVLFLHGSGESGDDLSLVKKHGPPKLVEKGKEFPFMIVSPQSSQDKEWVTEDVVALLNHIMRIHNVDDHRVYVTGLSMGGVGTWQVAGAMPDKIAAIIPIAGPAKVEVVDKVYGIPTWVFHGAKDTAAKLSDSEEMITLLKEKGGQPRFTIYPEAGHDSWTETYDNPEVYKWMLSHELKEIKKVEEEKEATKE